MFIIIFQANIWSLKQTIKTSRREKTWASILISSHYLIITWVFWYLCFDIGPQIQVNSNSLNFVQVFCTSLNGSTYETKFRKSGDRPCWASKILTSRARQKTTFIALPSLNLAINVQDLFSSTRLE